MDFMYLFDARTNLFSSRGFERANVLWLLSRIPFPLHTIFYVIERKWIYANHKRTRFIWPLIVQTSWCFFFVVLRLLLHPSIENWQRQKEVSDTKKRNLRSNALRNTRIVETIRTTFGENDILVRLSKWSVRVIYYGGKKSISSIA